MKSILLITIAAMTLPSPLAAQAFEDIAALDAQVASSIGTEGTGSIIPIDRRLKLARCPQLPLIDPPALGAIAVRCAPLGWRIRVGLVQYTSSTIAPTAPETLVHRGDAVELIVGGDGFDVSATAIALEDGALNKAIRVKTLTSKNPMIAVVKGAGAVQILR